MALNEFSKSFFMKPRIQEYINGSEYKKVYDAAPDAKKSIVLCDLYNLMEKHFQENILSDFSFLPDDMFSGTEIKAITIPSSIKYIGKNCFKNCQKLLEVDIQAPITEIPNSCFQDCGSLQQVVLPDTVDKIGRNAFSGVYPQIKIISNKTGRKIMVNQQDIPFFKDHFVQPQE